MAVNRIAMTIILLACGSIAGLVLASGQPLERTGGVLLFLVGVALLGWFGLRNARQGQRQSEVLLETSASPSAPKWRLGVSVLLLVLGGVVLATRSGTFSGYVFVAAGVAGLLGFNIFRGGPLDKRRPSS